jgi:hypothetical protein
LLEERKNVEPDRAGLILQPVVVLALENVPLLVAGDGSLALFPTDYGH